LAMVVFVLKILRLYLKNEKIKLKQQY